MSNNLSKERYVLFYHLISICVSKLMFPSLIKHPRMQQSLFKNTTQLINGVKSLDSKFNYTFNQDVSSNKDPSLNSVTPTLNIINPITNAYSRCSQQLIDGLLSFVPNERIVRFLADVAAQTQMPYRFIFHPGDTVAVKIGYIPNMNVVGIDTTKFSTRFYKIFLKVI